MQREPRADAPGASCRQYGSQTPMEKRESSAADGLKKRRESDAVGFLYVQAPPERESNAVVIQKVLLDQQFMRIFIELFQ